MTQDPVSFALDLSSDGIFLWHRKPSQKWEFLGSVPLTSGNLRQQLETLKQTAETIAAGPRQAIVRIPTAEVKIISIPDDPNAEISVERRIIQSLEAAAQRPIKEILFDIERGPDGSGVTVAWTLVDVVKQAETFVHLIGFTPTQYTTDVDGSAFPRRPNFQLQSEPAEKTPSETNETTAAMGKFEDTANHDQDQAEDVTANDPIVDEQTPKSEFGFMWFVALFLILGTIVAGIYLWPKIHRAAEQQSNAIYDQPNFASSSKSLIFPFEKGKMIL